MKLAKKQAEAAGKKKAEAKMDIKKVQAAAKIAKKHLESGRCAGCADFVGCGSCGGTVCMCVRVCLRVYTRMCVGLYTHACIHGYIYIHTVYTCMSVCPYTHTHT